MLHSYTTHAKPTTIQQFLAANLSLQEICVWCSVTGLCPEESARNCCIVDSPSGSVECCAVIKRAWHSHVSHYEPGLLSPHVHTPGMCHYNNNNNTLLYTTRVKCKECDSTTPGAGLHGFMRPPMDLVCALYNSMNVPPLHPQEQWLVHRPTPHSPRREHKHKLS